MEGSVDNPEVSKLHKRKKMSNVSHLPYLTNQTHFPPLLMTGHGNQVGWQTFDGKLEPLQDKLQSSSR